VLNGALSCLDGAGKTIFDEHVAVRPFPQITTGGTVLDVQRVGKPRGWLSAISEPE
jgi:hypothetical protein